MSNVKTTFFVAIFLAAILANAAEARIIDRTAALVNSDVVTLSDVESLTKNFSIRKELDPFVGFFQLELKSSQDIINHLIQETLIMQKFPPSKEEVEEEVNSVQRNNKIDRDKLKEVLLAQGVHFDVYYNLMKVSVSKRKLIDRELRPISAVSDDEIKSYYYTAPEFLQRRQEQKLVLSYSLAQLSVSDADVAEAMYKKLRTGEDMDSVRSEFSVKTSATIEKSNLGTFSEEKLAPAILAGLQGLKTGDVTKPISTGSGYILLKIIEIGAPRDPVFEKEKEQIRNKLFRNALSAQLKLWTERELAKSYIYIPPTN